MNYLFTNFVVGAANQFAHAAALTVANFPPQVYNPLLIHGNNGLGKTHLLQAIGQHIKTHNPAQRVVYLPAEQFVQELVALLKRDSSATFRHRYRQLDVLLIDDIHYLAGKTKSQEEFFHTFNTLHESGKQIVLSSTKLPRDITPLEPRLRSRLASGLIANIEPPDLETRLAILNRQAEDQRITVDSRAAMLIASTIRSNIAELEAALARVIAHASLHSLPIDITLTETILNQLIKEHDQSITAARIQKTVAQHFHLKVDDMQSKGRQRAVTFPRQIAMFLCRELTDASFPEIGRDFGGKDHTTVLHSHTKISHLEETDEDVAYLLSQLRQALKI